MNRDDVIRMAREAGLLIPSFRIGGGLALGTCTVPDFERFAALVAAAEREGCAITAWSIGMDLYNKQFDSREVGAHCAAAIRSRSDE